MTELVNICFLRITQKTLKKFILTNTKTVAQYKHSNN